MSNFKVGDFCLVVGNQCDLKGQKVKVTSVSNSGMVAFERLDGKDSCSDSAVGPGEGHELKLLEKTLDTLETGDILIDRGGTEKEVLAVLNGVVIVDDGDEDECTEVLITSRLEGYTIKGETQEVKEMTVAEISEALGHDVKVVKEK